MKGSPFSLRGRKRWQGASGTAGRRRTVSLVLVLLLSFVLPLCVGVVPGVESVAAQTFGHVLKGDNLESISMDALDRIHWSLAIFM